MSKLPPLSFENYYVLFEVEPQFTPKQLKTSYQKLIRIYHPDKNTNEDTNEIFQKIKDAFDVLSDESRKAEYDKGIKAKIQREERVRNMDKKRSRMKMDLEEKERQFKKRKLEEQQKQYSREYEKNQAPNVRRKMTEEYDQNLIQRHAQKLKEQQRKEAVNYNEDFIVLQWDDSKRRYTKEELMNIFGTFGTVGTISFVDSHIALLVYRKDNGAIKLMCSVQEGKQLGLPNNRIKATWLDNKSEQTHFETISPNTSSKEYTFKNLPKEKIFERVKFPTLQEHLDLEKRVLGILKNATEAN